MIWHISSISLLGLAGNKPQISKTLAGITLGFLLTGTTGLYLQDKHAVSSWSGTTGLYSASITRFSAHSFKITDCSSPHGWKMYLFYEIAYPSSLCRCAAAILGHWKQKTSNPQTWNWRFLVVNCFQRPAVSYVQFNPDGPSPPQAGSPFPANGLPLHPFAAAPAILTR